MELTNELMRVFALYFGCNIQYKRFSEVSQMYVLVDRVLNEDCLLTIKMLYGEHSLIEPKLTLRTIEQLTDEEAMLLADILFPTNTLSSYPEKKVYAGSMAIRFHLFNESWENDNEYDTASSRTIISEVRPYLMCRAFQYLISIGVALPLFFYRNHPENGKTAIELGIAIAATPPAAPSAE